MLKNKLDLHLVVRTVHKQQKPGQAKIQGETGSGKSGKRKKSHDQGRGKVKRSLADFGPNIKNKDLILLFWTFKKKTT